jgi:hypothetical protein
VRNEERERERGGKERERKREGEKDNRRERKERRRERGDHPVDRCFSNHLSLLLPLEVRQDVRTIGRTDFAEGKTWIGK